MGAHWENKTRDFRSLAFSVTLHIEKCRKYRYLFYHLTKQMASTTPISLNYLSTWGHQLIVLVILMQSQLVVYLPGGHWVHSLMTSLEEESIYVPKGHGRKRENSWLSSLTVSIG